jgi:hypothetical protein
MDSIYNPSPLESALAKNGGGEGGKLLASFFSTGGRSQLSAKIK